jgi:uncharacterized membrane protein YpjA
MALVWTAQWAKRLVAVPQGLALLLVVNLTAYFAGLLYWYGYVMTDPATPMWAWPFIPDCPLFALLGGLGLLMVLAQQQWSAPAQHEAWRTLRIMAVVALAVWGSTYLPSVGPGWRQQGAMFALLSWSLLLVAAWFPRAPVWLLGIFAFGQIKYGIWTITAWLLYWQSTAALLGAPHFSFDSILMTVTHIGLLGQGLLLLLYFRPTRLAAWVAFGWFGLSDFVDYGLGFYPAIPEELISLRVMQWSTIAVTVVLTGVYLWLAQGRQTGVTGGQEVDQAVGQAAQSV